MEQIKLYRMVITLLVVMIIVLSALLAGLKVSGTAYAQSPSPGWGKYHMQYRVMGDGNAIFYIINTQTGDIHVKDQSDKLLFTVTYNQ